MRLKLTHLAIFWLALSLLLAGSARAAVTIRAEFVSTPRSETGSLRIFCASDIDLSGFSVPIRFLGSAIRIDSIALASQVKQLGFSGSGQIGAARDRALVRIIPSLSIIPTIRPNNEELFRIFYKVDPNANLGLVIADTFIVRYQSGDLVWWDRLEASDELGNLILPAFDYGGVTVTLGPPTDAEDEIFTPLPTSFLLGQNFPNPFNPSTTIPFELPRACLVTLEICDLAGHIVQPPTSIVAGPGPASIEVSLADMPSGVYFYRLRTPFGDQTRKMILLK